MLTLCHGVKLILLINLTICESKVRDKIAAAYRTSYLNGQESWFDREIIGAVYQTGYSMVKNLGSRDN